MHTCLVVLPSRVLLLLCLLCVNLWRTNMIRYEVAIQHSAKTFVWMTLENVGQLHKSGGREIVPFFREEMASFAFED